MVQNDSMGREKTFNIRFSDAESGWLEALAKHYGLTSASVLRMLIKERYDGLVEVKESDEDELFSEALRKWTRQVQREGATPVQPNRNLSGIERRGAHRQFVLRNQKGELVRFDVTPSGDLRSPKS